MWARWTKQSSRRKGKVKEGAKSSPIARRKYPRIISEKAYPVSNRAYVKNKD